MGGITEEQTPFLYDDATVARVTAERRAALPLEKIGERSAWRDRRLMGVLGHKKSLAKNEKLKSSHRLSENHWNSFLLPRSSPREWVGDAPNLWFKKNKLELDPRLSSLASRPMSRTAVKDIAQDPNLDPLNGYVAAMAWGRQQNRGTPPGHAATAWKARERLRSICDQIRNDPNLDRRAAYKLLSGESAVSGLGPAYATKLLYFFRKNSDFYIMDQWSGWSINLLFERKIVKMAFQKNREKFVGSVRQDNTPDDYANFCEAVDEVTSKFNEIFPGTPLTSEKIEERLFDIGGRGSKAGDWRRYVRARPLI
jgi:hypothetical protein